MAITSMTIRGLVDEDGDTVIRNVDAATLVHFLSYTCSEVAAMSSTEFFFAALNYLEMYTSIADTDSAKIDTWY
jgi:hypothetical protein